MSNLMRYKFYTADVFTDQIFGGNQLVVFPHAGGLETAQMQKIAQEFNISETVFVFPSQTPEYHRKLRIFTPSAEIPFAGHPTVGTAYVLAAIAEISLQGEITKIIFEEGVGAVPVKIYAQAGKPVYSELTVAQMPEFSREIPSLAELAALLSLDPEDLCEGDFSPQAVSCGLPFLFIPLRNREAVAKAKLNSELWQKLLADSWARQVYIFSQDPELPGSDLRSRMFAPGLGITEDPATGSAAAALAGYLGVRHSLTSGTLEWSIEQGFEMGRPSLLKTAVDKKDGVIQEIRVTGSSILVSEGTLTLPAN